MGGKEVSEEFVGEGSVVVHVDGISIRGGIVFERMSEFGCTQK